MGMNPHDGSSGCNRVCARIGPESASRRRRALRRRQAAMAKRERRRERIRQTRLRMAAAVTVAFVMLLPVAFAVHRAGTVSNVSGRPDATYTAATWCATGMTPVIWTQESRSMNTLPRPMAQTIVGTSNGACRRMLSWPLRRVEKLAAFDAPAQPWLAGHRGVDLAAEERDELVAPADGVVSFVGIVAGKQVVGIRHADLTLTFEPAISELRTGAKVTRDEPFGMVGARSDHCDGSCLHWGVRRGDDYLDPVAMSEPRRIALKPVSRR